MTGITLQSGANVITVTARDAANNYEHAIAHRDVHAAPDTQAADGAERADGNGDLQQPDQPELDGLDR